MELQKDEQPHQWLNLMQMVQKQPNLENPFLKLAAEWVLDRQEQASIRRQVPRPLCQQGRPRCKEEAVL